MLKPGDRVRVTSPDGKTKCMGILIERQGKNYWKLTIVDPGTTEYKKGTYVAFPVGYVRKM